MYHVLILSRDYVIRGWMGGLIRTFPLFRWSLGTGSTERAVSSTCLRVARYTRGNFSKNRERFRNKRPGAMPRGSQNFTHLSFPLPHSHPSFTPLDPAPSPRAFRRPITFTSCSSHRWYIELTSRGINWYRQPGRGPSSIRYARRVRPGFSRPRRARNVTSSSVWITRVSECRRSFSYADSPRYYGTRRRVDNAPEITLARAVKRPGWFRWNMRFRASAKILHLPRSLRSRRRMGEKNFPLPERFTVDSTIWASNKRDMLNNLFYFFLSIVFSIIICENYSRIKRFLILW